MLINRDAIRYFMITTLASLPTTVDTFRLFRIAAASAATAATRAKYSKMEPSKERKRKLSDNAAVKCIIGQPKQINSSKKCELCSKDEAAFERNFYLGIGQISSKEADRSTLIRICVDCSGILEKLNSFRKQAFCSSKYLLSPGAEKVQPLICRFCFVTGDGLVDTFDDQGRVLDSKLLDQIRDWLEISFDPRDSVTKLCWPCIRSIKALAVLGVGPSMDIVFPKKDPSQVGISKPKLSKKAQREKREVRDEMDQNLRQLLQAPHEGRNFTVLTAEAEPRIQVVFEKYCFRLAKRFPSGSTAWKCVFNRLRICAAEIEINPAGTDATLSGRHNHAAGSEKLLEYPQGKGRTSVDGVDRSFFLTYGASGKSPYTRALVLGGHRFYLLSIARNGASKWCCNRSWGKSCRVVLTVEGLFEAIHLCGSEHAHDPYPEANIERYLKECGVSLDGEDLGADSPAEQVIDTRPAEPEQAQNFTMNLTADQKVQIKLNGHDFQWNDELAGWCCVWSEIRRCPVQIQLSPNGKVATLVDPTSEHNHSDEVVAIFWQKFGKYLIFDEHESNEFYYKLAGCKEEYQPNRSIDYQGYRYRLVAITDSGDSDWKCERCEATVRVMGLFWIIDYRCLHSHRPLTWQELDYDEDLLPHKSTELTVSVPRSPSALLKLLSIDEPERNFQMHHRGDLMKILQDGFEYYYSCSKPNYSLWKCFYSTIRGCGASLHVDNHGRLGTPSNSSQHNHTIELWDLYYHRLGEGSIRNESTGVPSPFFFLMKPDFLRPLPHIIYQGHLFTMSFITELGECSKWRCVAKNCCVTANVTGLFEAIRVHGLPHCDEPLSGEEKRRWIGRYGTPDEF